MVDCMKTRDQNGIPKEMLIMTEASQMEEYVELQCMKCGVYPFDPMLCVECSGVICNQCNNQP